MADYPIRLACLHYDRTTAIVTGSLRPPGVDLRVTEQTSVPGMFAAMFRGEFDASEMSLAELIYYTSRDRCDFVAIPVFPSRVFRHAFLYVNTGSGIRRPEELDGKRIGFPRFVQTACIWIRGMLIDEYGISPQRTRWLIGRTHHWGGAGEDDVLQTRDGSRFEHLPSDGRHENETVERALVEGTIDALGTALMLESLAAGDPRVARLFPDYRVVEAAYYRKRRIFPIMHVLAIRKDVVARHPDLPLALFTLFVQARRRALEWLRVDPSLGLVWKNVYLAAEREVFGGDPWTYGLPANAHTLEKFLAYCDAMGVTARPLTPRDLFHPDTWDLTEEVV
jgi:4,5-dihydroxyphthalate decarboxylase